MTASSADRDPLDRLAEEFVARFRAGERPSLAEYEARLPDRADEVRQLFPALVELEQLKPNTVDHTGDYTTTVGPSDPTRVGEFRILRRVGVGGMGAVYEAIQESLGRHVALKLLPLDAAADPKRLERFRREAKAAAKLHHTNIVPVFGTGEADGRHFYAMQFIAGHPLDAVIDEVRRLKDKSAAAAPRAVSEVANALVTGTFRPPPSSSGGIESRSGKTLAAATSPTPAEPSAVSSPSLSDGGRAYWGTVARLVAQAADALAYAHVQGVLHRDIKPSNLLLDLRGTLWVADFGLAKSTDADDLTHAGDVIGTLRYMAPERFEGQGDQRADVYALGLTLYELLALRPAFVATNRAKLVEQAIAADPPKPRSINPAIPRDLETIVLKAIQRDPAMRYQTAGELAEDLRRYLEYRPIRARRATATEQAVRWCRRNPAVASLLTAVLLVFAAGAFVASVFAVRADDERGKAEAREREANAARRVARTALAEADAARVKAQRQVVRLDITTAAQLGDRGDYDQAFHWVVRSWRDDLARLKPDGRLTPGEVADHRLRVASAAERLPRLVGFCPHERPVLDADCDSNGGRVVTLVGNSFARVWASERAELAFPPLAHGGRVTSAVFSLDGSSLATSSTDGFARVWDSATGVLRNSLNAGGPVARVAYHPDGKTLAVAAGSMVSGWDLATGRIVGNSLRAGGLVEYVAYSPDGSRIVTVAQPETIKLPLINDISLPRAAVVWDAATGRLLGAAPHARFGAVDFNTLPPGWESSFERLRWPRFSPDSRSLVTSDAGSVYLWDNDGYQRAIQVKTSPGHEQTTAAFTPDGKSVLSATRDLGVRCYDLTSRKIQLPHIRPDRRCAGFSISPDGKLIAATITGGPTTFYELSSRVPLPGLPMSAQEQLTALKFRGDGTRLLTASADGAVRVWQRPDTAPVEPYHRDCGRADRDRMLTRVFSPDARWVATFDPKTLGLTVGPSGSALVPLPHPVFSYDTVPGDTSGIRNTRRFAARFSPTGQHLVTAGPGQNGNGIVRLWEVKPDGITEVATAATGRVVEFSFSADGRRVAVGVRGAGWKELPGVGDVDRFAVWAVPTLDPIFDVGVPEVERFIGQAHLNHDGTILTVRNGGTDRLCSWELTNGKRLPGGTFPAGDILDLAVGPIDGRVAVVSSARTLTQLDPIRGTPVGAQLTGMFGKVTYSPDQRWLAVTINAGNTPHRVQIYNANSGELLATVPASGVKKMWFSADGRRLVLSDLRGKTVACRLGNYSGPEDCLPTLARLLTGLEENTGGEGFLPLVGDAIRTDPETYRRAFRDWKGITPDGR